MAREPWTPNSAIIPDGELTKATPNTLTDADMYNANLKLFQDAINGMNNNLINWIGDALLLDEVLPTIIARIEQILADPAEQAKYAAILAKNGDLIKLLSQNPDWITASTTTLSQNTDFQAACAAVLTPLVVSAASQEILTDESLLKELATKLEALAEDSEAFKTAMENATKGLLEADSQFKTDLANSEDLIKLVVANVLANTDFMTGVINNVVTALPTNDTFITTLAGNAQLLANLIKQIVDQNLLGDKLPFPSITNLFPAGTAFAPTTVDSAYFALETDSTGALTGKLKIIDLDITGWGLSGTTATTLSALVKSFWTITYDDGT